MASPRAGPPQQKHQAAAPAAGAGGASGRNHRHQQAPAPRVVAPRALAPTHASATRRRTKGGKKKARSKSGRFSVRRSLGNSVKRLSRGSSARRRASLVDAEEVLDVYCGVPLLFLRDLRDGIRDGSVASGLVLYVAKVGINVDVRAGSTFELVSGEFGAMEGRGAFGAGPFTFSADQASVKPRDEWTMQDVSDFVVGARTFEQLAEEVTRKPVRQGQRFQGGIVTYAGSSGFFELVAALLEHYARSGKPAKSQFVFLHLFDRYGRVMEASALARERALLHSGVASAMEGFDEVLVFMNTWADPLPLSRARCLWELYAGIKAGRQPAVLFVPGSDEALMQALESDFERLSSHFSHMALLEAACHNEVHLGFIHEAARAEPGSFERIDLVVRKAVSVWLVENLKNAVVAFRQGRGLELLRDGDPETCARVFSHAGRLMSEVGQPVFAVRYYREALRLLKQLGGNPTHIAAVCGNIAIALTDMGELSRSLTVYEEALSLFRRHNADGASDEQIASTLLSMGEILADLGEPEEAETHLEEARALFTRLRGPSDLQVASALFHLAAIDRGRGSHQAAFGKLERALETRVKLLGREDPEVADTLAAIGHLHVAMGDHEEGLGLLRKALRIHREAGMHLEMAQLLVATADVHAKLGVHEAALQALREALQTARDHFGDAHPLVSSALLEIGQVLLAAGENTKAIKVFAQALELIKKTSPTGRMHPSFARVLLSSADALELQGDLDLAVERVEEAARILSITLGEDHEATQDANRKLDAMMSRLT